MMRKHPNLRQMDIGGQFVSKEEQLRDLDAIDFCQDHDRVIIDGTRIIRS